MKCLDQQNRRIRKHGRCGFSMDVLGFSYVVYLCISSNSSFKLAMTDDVCRFFLILIGAHNGQSYSEGYVTFM